MFVLIVIKILIKMKSIMKMIQITLKEDLLNQVDKAIHELNTTRSAFIRESVRFYLERLRIKKLEKRHRDGYLKQPIEMGEFDIWEDEQVRGTNYGTR